ncbi:MAG TPA: M28 family peptidase [Stackebrandtia sp.]|jgi:aminopeptidase S|uniref:M28 family peptidase n=1 Tax=Stackebrandtia sp. TaxID=2023065 RepID=UPI002D617AFB|nr:M28 family peptidase [Stackebrandtia sp.]HZE39689.1 M28 family peptidase [Stackebrandtia sp.]
MRRRSLVAIAVGVATAGALALAPVAMAAPVSATAPDINVDDVQAHLKEFQSIADAAGGTRHAGSDGYQKSADYVVGKLKDAGYDVTTPKCGSCSADDVNVIADWPGGDDSATIMVGAHLDSVSAGPGINDNGSGSATVLQVALALAQAKPDLAKHVRFGWWADEEQGLNGSADYVKSGGADGVEAYFNLDMVASPNAGYFVDGLDNQYGKAMADYLTSVKKEPDQMEECCSDDGSFRDAGVPIAFLSTGASAQMTQEEADKWGGEAGKAFDECYHSACDTSDNINADALNNMADALAAGLWAAAVKS